MLISLKCPQCSGDLSAGDDKDFYFCPYCGTKVVHEKPETHNHYETRQNVTKNYYGGRANPDELFDRWVNALVNGGDSHAGSEAFVKECYDDNRVSLVRSVEDFLSVHAPCFDEYLTIDSCSLSIEALNGIYNLTEILLPNGSTKEDLFAYFALIKDKYEKLYSEIDKKNKEKHEQEERQRQEIERQEQVAKKAANIALIVSILTQILLIFLTVCYLNTSIDSEIEGWLGFLLITSNVSFFLTYTTIGSYLGIIGILLKIIGFPGTLLAFLIFYLVDKVVSGDNITHISSDAKSSSEGETPLEEERDETERQTRVRAE